MASPRSGSGKKRPDADGAKRLRERALRRPFSFEAQAHGQSHALAKSQGERGDQAFIDAMSVSSPAKCGIRFSRQRPIVELVWLYPCEASHSSSDPSGTPSNRKVEK
jgi:hypothetical protein